MTLDELKRCFANIGGKSFVHFLNDNPKLCDYICSEEHNFFKAPASTKYHGSYPGGLIEHSYNVAYTLYDLTINNGLEWERVISPFIVGLFHDICKIDNYICTNEDAIKLSKNDQCPYIRDHGNIYGPPADFHCNNVNRKIEGLVCTNVTCEHYVIESERTHEYYKQPIEYIYNDNTLFKGHGEKSLMILSSLCKLTEEEAACIRYHMGAFNDKSYEWNDYTRAIHKYPNVLWTHHADMIATHIMEVKNEQ